MLYDEVSEDAYQSIVRGRMMEDDFIEDDDGSGYVDHGQYEWETGDHSESDTEDEHEYFERTGRKKPKKGSKRARHAASAQGDYLGVRRAPRDALNASRMSAGAPAKETEDAFMSKLFGGLEQMSTPARPMAALALHEDSFDSPTVALARKRKQSAAPTPTTLPPLVADTSSTVDMSSDPPEEHEWAREDSAKKLKSDDSDEVWPREEPPKKEAPASDAMEDDDFGRVSVAAKHEERRVNAMSRAPAIAAAPTAAPAKPQPETPTPLQSWHSVQTKLETSPEAVPDVQATSGNAAAAGPQVFESDRSVHFYWIDYFDAHGKLYLFGKVLDQSSGRFVSCCVMVDGIERCLFLQPRPRVLSHGHETDVVPGEDEVFEEFEALRARYGIKSWLGKWVTRKYAFELPDVPAEGEYLKVKYGFDEPALPADVSGATFARAFGTNTTAFELFVLKRRIMGPCWLRIEHAQVPSGAPQTWCKLELAVDDPKSVAPLETEAGAPKEAPPLTVLSLAVRSVVNFKENKREVVAVSARVWRDLSLENATPPEKLPSSSFTAVRPLGPSFPARFEAEAARGRTKIKAFKFERMVLNSLLGQIQLADADVILGHDFVGSTLDVLLHRMRDLKCENWTRLGRMRADVSRMTKQALHTRMFAGRLVADLSSDMAKGMISSTSWSLSEMCRTHLGMQREDIDPEDVASYFDCAAPTPERLLTFVRHCEVDAYFHMALAHKVQLLALTKQLTNLAGNAWSRTLNGGRSERNEYILLHEFHRKKYICPDKYAWERKRRDETEKKDKFKGGLVFEPKRGLWDKYILVMDFNSLYPSIIQEYNIDFTTVDRSGVRETDEVPEVPSSDVAQGVLPHLIATLVTRRRQVKALMKDRHAPALKQLQWNIKQMALKLTANSMYGCLGFENSRFYARPLAALTTFKGREILSTTRELAESMGLDVVYGDTDSVMINTNVVDYAAAVRIGHEFRRAVNERYRLLEIDIDGVFQRMLLLQKKKYAALLVDESGQKHTEIKGLDMKRREYCALSKHVSSYVLEQILSGDATEMVVARIHEHLRQVADDVHAGRVPLDDFVIFKRLGKRPQDYPDAGSQPHVQVALRMLAKNESARSGDVIPYVFCVGAGAGAGAGSDAKMSQAVRAYHPDDVRRHVGEDAYAIDYRYYLAHQILPPIERIAESIEGTDRARLAECLGLDVHVYAAAPSAADASREFAPLDSQVPSAVRYAHCAPVVFRCRACHAETAFDGIGRARDDGVLSASRGVTCGACQAPLGTPSLVVQLERAIREHIARYYRGWTTCTEPSCGAVTPMAGVYSGRCLVAGCRGKVVPQYSDKELYTQLCYMAYLFDPVQALAEIGDAAQRTYVREVLDTHRPMIDTLHATVQQYLARNGRRFVGLGKLFAFMRI